MSKSAPMISERMSWGGSTNNTTVYQQQRLIQNAMVDYDKYKSDLFNMKEKKKGKFHTFYDVTLGEYDVTILQSDLVFSMKLFSEDILSKYAGERYEGGAGDSGQPKIFGAFNGLGYYDHDGVKKMLFDDKTGRNNVMMKYEIRKLMVFMGVAQGNFVVGPEGLNTETARLDISIQKGGLESLINKGHLPIRSGNYVVWNAPDPSQLHMYPPRLNDINGGYTQDTVFASTEPYDPSSEFNLSNVFRCHLKAFPYCSEFDFGNCDNLVTYLPSNFKTLECDFSLEGYHKALFGSVFAIGAIFEAAMTEVYKLDDSNKKWDSNIKASDIQEILCSAQDIVYQATSNRIQTHTDKLRVKRILMASLIAIEAAYFSDDTDIYRSNGMKPGDTFELKGLLGTSTNTMMNIMLNITHEQRSRIIGRALTSAAPGYSFDCSLGNVYSF
jgi:hypothetical protein